MRYKPIYLERERKRLRIKVIRYCGSDINLFTSQGDGNILTTSSTIRVCTDINLFTSRGDGNAGVSLVLGAVLGKVRI